MNREITRADIRQLEVHARCTGAFALAQMCVDAWNGDEWAWAQCVQLLRMGILEEE